MKLYKKLGICLLSYLIFGLIITLGTSRIGYLFLVWNVFLAYLPLLFVRLLGRHLACDTRKKPVVAGLAVLWLLFFPNAPYMITDLIYFSNASYFVKNGYTTSVLAWAMLVFIGFGALFGILMGLKSFYEMHQIILRHKGKKIAYAAIIVTSLLSGFAIYIGRILRFNSWDILHPITLLTRIQHQFTSFSLSFSLLFALFTLGSYAVYYTLVHKD
jgi:uncharacterized membrane protein